MFLFLSCGQVKLHFMAKGNSQLDNLLLSILICFLLNFCLVFRFWLLSKANLSVELKCVKNVDAFVVIDAMSIKQKRMLNSGSVKQALVYVQFRDHHLKSRNEKNQSHSLKVLKPNHNAQLS